MGRAKCVNIPDPAKERQTCFGTPPSPLPDPLSLAMARGVPLTFGPVPGAAQRVARTHGGVAVAPVIQCAGRAPPGRAL